MNITDRLRDATCEPLTARDFRTWAGTVECAVALRDIGESSSETHAKKNIVAAIRTAAGKLGNRVATCRAYYVHPAVPDSYLQGTLPQTMAKVEEAAIEGLSPKELSEDECAVLAVVRRYRPVAAESAPIRQSSGEKTAPPGIRDAA